MRSLSREALDHDDPNHGRHRRDKKAKEERDGIAFVAIPSPLGISGKQITGVDFDPDSAGFMIEFGDSKSNASAAFGDTPLPPPQKVDGKEYRQRILKEEKARRRFRRTVAKDGKELDTWGYHKSGGVSLVVTVPPWAMETINSLEDDVRERLIMDTAHAAAIRVQKVSGRVAWGAGCHQDTAIAHWHFQIPKTAPDGTNWEKTKFRTGGNWLTGTDRIDRKFPDLLSKKQKEIMEEHKQKKGQLVDLEIAIAVDGFLEQRFIEMGLEHEYEESCKEYVKRKKKAQEVERQGYLLKESMKFFTVEGIWPLSFSVMKFVMWRMIPSPYRKLVIASIRLTQFIELPSIQSVVKLAAKEMINKLSEIKQPEMKLPKLK